MIDITREPLTGAGAQGILRPVSDRLEPVSAASRDVGISAGADLLARLETFGDLPGGAAVVTPPGDLACDLLIHVSVQDPGEPASETTVERAFLNGLRRAAALGLDSIACPPLGTGAQGLDAESAARAMGRALREHRLQSSLPARIVLAVASDYEEDVFARLLKETGDEA